MNPVRHRRLGALFVLVGLAMAMYGGIMNDRANGDQEELEKNGIRVEGTVIATNHDAKVTDTARVQFVLDGEERRALVYIDDVDVGDRVTVLVDREDHRRVGVEGGTQLHGLREGTAMVLLLTGLFVVAPFGAWLIFTKRSGPPSETNQ